MKKAQRSFAVEYKSGRRKTEPKSNSIWGDINLKSLSQDVLEEAMPFLPVGSPDNKTGAGGSLSPEDPAGPLLTVSIEHQTTASDLQERDMADENDTITIADAPAAATPDVPKKQRKPRAKKAAAEMGTVEAVTEPAAASNASAGKQRRGRKPRSSEGATSAKRVPVKRGPKAMQTAAAPSPAAIDEMADLLQLEEENRRLRKLLAEKLRAENADLRKRLNLD
ncbi:transcriptional regulator [Neorhizobium huautlense]|uniref:transcriptional regulator n=1 Tax=Neorhizobium huautlense TaxID=67774 RepID=UPI000CF8FAF1|nr:transcriptional regulator [Neorhizobium huautlense]